MAEETSTLHRGLREVYIDRTTSSYIDGKAGKLWYRGYSIDDLASNCTFEEVIYLVMNGELPTQSELDTFVQELSDNMTLPEAIIDIIRITKDAHPMDVLRTAISALAALSLSARPMQKPWASPGALTRSGTTASVTCSNIAAVPGPCIRGRQNLTPWRNRAAPSPDRPIRSPRRCAPNCRKPAPTIWSGSSCSAICRPRRPKNPFQCLSKKLCRPFFLWRCKCSSKSTG